MRLFKVNWVEYHDPVNWEVKTPKEMKKELEQGTILFAKKRGFKIKADVRLDPNENDGWYECEMTAIFKAKNIQEAIKIVEDENLYDESSCVYSGFEKIKGKWQRSFTEEGID